jgi:hypothetical protein
MMANELSECVAQPPQPAARDDDQPLAGEARAPPRRGRAGEAGERPPHDEVTVTVVFSRRKRVVLRNGPRGEAAELRIGLEREVGRQHHQLA